MAQAAFTKLDMDRIDDSAIAGPTPGLALIEQRRYKACRAWILQEGYAIESIDFRLGISEVVPALGRRFVWQARFGYSLEPDNRNLDALRDGFEFGIPDGGGLVLEILWPDLGFQEDTEWMRGLLWIIQEHCIRQLALGRRFFALLVIPEEDSPLIGKVIYEQQIPGVFWSPCREVHEFLR